MHDETGDYEVQSKAKYFSKIFVPYHPKAKRMFNMLKNKFNNSKQCTKSLANALRLTLENQNVKWELN